MGCDVAAYTLAIAHELTAQLSRIKSMPPQLLAGHAANFHFWADEVAHCLTVIDGYEERFQRMLAAQNAAIDAAMHIDPRPVVPIIPQRLIPRPGRVTAEMRYYVRSELCHAFHGFAVSCYHKAHVGADVVHAACDRLSISISEHDVPRPA